MRVFVAGAAGAIGKPLVGRLLESGHQVWGTTRSRERAEWLRSRGVTPVIVDAMDTESLRRAVLDACPEVVIDQLTDLPQEFNPRRMDRFYQGYLRLNREARPALLEAATAAGARRHLFQSVAFLYSPGQADVNAEDARPFTGAPPPWDVVIPSLLGMERMVLEAPGSEGIVLRYGYFYGPGTAYAPDGDVARMIRRRAFPIVDGGTGVFSFIHVEDAASATVAAIERGTSGVFNVVDDEPAPMREWLPVVAAALGARRPLRVPLWLARLAGGRFVAEAAVRMRGASNDKAKRELGWTLRWPSWRQGFAEAAG